MSRYEYEDDHDDHYEMDDRDNDDYHQTSTSTANTYDTHSDSYDDYEYGTSFSNGAVSSNASHGYQFSVSNGAIVGITEIENGYAEQEQIEYGETWTVNGNQVIKNELEHGFTQTSVYADLDGDGVFNKISQTYSTQNTPNPLNTLSAQSIQGGNDADDIWTGTATSDDYYGSVGNDLLHGGYGDDDLYGGNDNDDLYGDDGADHLYGSNGDDHLYGGVGTDEAFFEGNHTEYLFTATANGLALRDSEALRDGTDVLESIERIHFSDTSVALDTDGAAGQAYRLYKAAFDRESDDEGLGYWMAALENGVTLNTVANAFVSSDEFGTLYGDNCTDEDFVNLLYNNVLDRDAESTGYAYWMNALDTGLTRADVLVCFSESTENQTNVAELIGSGITYQVWPG